MAKVIEPISRVGLMLHRVNSIAPIKFFKPSSPSKSSHFGTLTTETPRASSTSILCSGNHFCTFTNNDFNLSLTAQKPVKKNKRKTVIPKLSPDPEKQKHAVLIKKLYKTNKDMFGDLLESSKEKSQRVKKETQLLRKQKILDPQDAAINEPKETADSSNPPKSFPMIERRVFNQEEVNVKAEKVIASENKLKAKEAEINWTMKINPKMMRIIKGDFPKSLDTKFTQESIETNTKNNNETKRGLISKASSRGQSSSSSIIYKSSTYSDNEAQIIFPTHEQFVSSLSTDLQLHQKPELKLIKNTEENQSDIKESNHSKRISDATSNRIKTGRIYHKLFGKRSNDSKSATVAITMKEMGILDLKDRTLFKSDANQENGQIVVEGVVDDDSKEEEIHSSSKILNPENKIETSNLRSNNKASTTVDEANVYNQKSSSLIINVPYFNRERQLLAASLHEKSVGEIQDVDQEKEERNSRNNNDNQYVAEGNQKNEIISIPFFRSCNSINNNTHDHRNNIPYNSLATTNILKDAESPLGTLNQGLNQQVQFPSVSKILNATMPSEQVKVLERWQAKMMTELGEEGFRLYKENMFRNGKMLHSNIETFLRGTPMEEISIENSITGHWNSLKNFLTVFDEVLVLESRVVHPQLGYAGIVDCVAVFQNQLVVIDWKTSQKQKPFVAMTYDTPLQIAAYIGAINYDPNYSLKIDHGLIVIAYEDGQPCQTFLLNPKEVSKYWRKWLDRLKLFTMEKTSA